MITIPRLASLAGIGKWTPLKYCTNSTKLHVRDMKYITHWCYVSHPLVCVCVCVCRMREVDIGEGKALLVYQGGEYMACGHKCTHYGAPLIKGALGNGRVRCPWHGACFNVKTGDIEDFPGLDGIAVHQVWMEGEGRRGEGEGRRGGGEWSNGRRKGGEGKGQ